METNIIDKQKMQVLAAKISIFGSIILFLISASIGIAVDSITLLLDASASLVILLVAFLIRMAVKKIHLPADERFNFGYSKYEPLTVAVQGVLIIITCIISISFAIQDIIHAENVHNYSLPVAATFISGIMGIFITGYLKKIGEHTNSTMLKTASLHWYADTILSFGVCFGFIIGFILQYRGYNKITPYVDPVMAIILALLLMQAPVKTVMCNVLELLDIVPAKDIHNKVKAIIDTYKPKFFGIERLRVRKAGEKIFADVCFVVDNNLAVFEAEELARSLEKDLKAHIPSLDIIVHFKSIR